MSERDLTAIPEPTYSTNEFCAVENKSRTQLYKEWRMGIGPEFYMNGNRRRITHQARLEYQRRRLEAAREGK